MRFTKIEVGLGAPGARSASEYDVGPRVGGLDASSELSDRALEIAWVSQTCFVD